MTCCALWPVRGSAQDFETLLFRQMLVNAVFCTLTHHITPAKPEIEAGILKRVKAFDVHDRGYAGTNPEVQRSFAQSHRPA